MGKSKNSEYYSKVNKLGYMQCSPMVTYLIILPTIADKLYYKHTNTNNKPVKQSFDKGIVENCPNKPRSGRNFMEKQLAWWTSLKQQT